MWRWGRSARDGEYLWAHQKVMRPLKLWNPLLLAQLAPASWAQSSLCPFANSLLRSMFIRFIRFFLALMRFSLTTSRERHKPSYPKNSATNRLLFSLKGKKKIKPKQKIEGKKRTSPRHKNISFAPVVQMELKTVKTEGLSPQLDHSGTT